MKTKTFIIGIMGFARVGKSTIAEGLSNRIDGSVVMGFADYLKSICADLFTDLGLDITNNDDKIKGRDILVAVGRAGRNQNENFWVNEIAERINAEQPAVAIISDVRYLNEVTWILAQGGIVIDLERNGVHAANTEEQNSIALVRATHLLAWNNTFYRVSNDGSIGHTVDQAYEVIKERLPKPYPRYFSDKDWPATAYLRFDARDRAIGVRKDGTTYSYVEITLEVAQRVCEELNKEEAEALVQKPMKAVLKARSTGVYYAVEGERVWHSTTKDMQNRSRSIFTVEEIGKSIGDGIFVAVE
jgi:hypothetical protein